LTVLFTDPEMSQLERVAAYYSQSKSVAAHDMIMKALREDLQVLGNDALAEVEVKQDDWRTRMGL